MSNLIWRLFNSAVMLVVDRPLPPPTAKELELTEHLRTKFRSFPPIETAGLPPSEAAWKSYMQMLKELVLSKDPREFLRWGAVSLMMGVSRVSFREELRYLQRSPQWRSRWRGALRESMAGHPTPYALHPASSASLIRHACHVARFEEHTGMRAEDFSFVLEFGGGFGNMCRLFHRLGFRGTYVIFDLPLFSYLQEYYLQANGIPLLPEDELPANRPGALCISNFEQLERTVSSLTAAHGTLFVANESFSEIPVQQRGKFSPLFASFEAFLISYSHRYREVDNEVYFNTWRERFGGAVRWSTWPVKHMPGYSYLMGRRVLTGG